MATASEATAAVPAAAAAVVVQFDDRAYRRVLPHFEPRFPTSIPAGSPTLAAACVWHRSGHQAVRTIGVLTLVLFERIYPHQSGIHRLPSLQSAFKAEECTTRKGEEIPPRTRRFISRL